MSTEAQVTTGRRGRPRLTEAQRAEQRGQLVDAAMEAIRRHGPEVSIDDIAADCGVSKPVLYGHFGDKIGLADAISEALADRITRQGSELLGAPDGAGAVTEEDFRRAIEVIVEAMIDLVDTEPEVYGFLTRTIRHGDSGFFDNAMVEVIRERGAQLVEIVQPDVDQDRVRVLVDGTFGFLFFAIESWRLNRRPPREEMVPVLADAIVEGFRRSLVQPR